MLSRMLIAHGALRVSELSVSLRTTISLTHQVLLQSSCCSHSNRLQTIMGMELQLRQSNFGSFSTTRAQLRQGMDYGVASEIIGAYYVESDDKDKEWFVKVPNLTAAEDSSLIGSPDVKSVPEREQAIQEYVHTLSPSVLTGPDGLYLSVSKDAASGVQDQPLISGQCQRLLRD